MNDERLIGAFAFLTGQIAVLSGLVEAMRDELSPEVYERVRENAIRLGEARAESLTQKITNALVKG